jgi:hypothetical protein
LKLSFFPLFQVSKIHLQNIYYNIPILFNL